MKYSILFLLLLPILLGAQDDSEQVSFFQDWKYSVSYFGNNIINPGLLLGVEKVRKEKRNVKEREEYLKAVFHQSVWDVKAGFFIDNPSHTSAFAYSSINYRRVKGLGKYIIIGAGPGITRNFLRETYRVNGSSVEKVRFPGRNYFMLNTSLGTGRLWNSRGTRAWQMKLHVNYLFNYNKTILPILGLEYGYSFGYKSKVIWNTPNY